MLTDEERQLFDKKRALSGMTMHEFLMSCLQNKKIVVKPGADMLIVQIKRIGNNLNQITRRINAGQLTDCRAELREIRDELAALRSEWQS